MSLRRFCLIRSPLCPDKMEEISVMDNFYLKNCVLKCTYNCYHFTVNKTVLQQNIKMSQTALELCARIAFIYVASQ